MLAIAILAAGKGTRMQSTLPKVLHQLSGRSLLERVLSSYEGLNPDRQFLIVGHRAEEVKKNMENHSNLEFVLQVPQNGTGHAIQQLIPLLSKFKGDILILNGDVPLLTNKTVRQLIDHHRKCKAGVTFLSTRQIDPTGYGRVFSNEKFEVDSIIEDSDCTPEQRKNNLTNAGIYCFNWEELSEVLTNLSTKNSQSELYLTDTVSMISKAIHFELQDPKEVMGINNRIQQAECEQIIQEKLRNYWMNSGVSFIDPSSCYISEESSFGKDVIIEPNTHFKGKCEIKDSCKIGPDSLIVDSMLGRNTKVVKSVVEDSEVGDNVNIGPFSHLRPESVINNKVKIGNFVEIKKSEIGENTKVSHLSYIGDATLGKGVNIGAGTITANFDGIKKSKTVIGDLTKTGANSVLIAPITLGSKVTVGAGSTISKDISNSSLVVARPKTIVKNDWQNSSDSSKFSFKEG